MRVDQRIARRVNAQRVCVHMKRTIYQRLRARAKTTTMIVEGALRRAAETAEGENERRRVRQQSYLSGLSDRADLEVLATENMWR